MRNTTPIEQLWTVADVAEYLQMSRAWVYKAVAMKELAASRFGSRLRFNPAVVKQLAVEKTAQASI